MEFLDGIVRKTGDSSILAVEAAKTQLAGKIGHSSGLFYVPKLLKFDAEAGILEFERLEGLLALRKIATRKEPRIYDLLSRVGEALAVVHDNLVLPDELREELPAEWIDKDGENVFIHGDFDGFNVCYHEPTDRIVILDWSAAPLLNRTPTFGSRFFDMLWFVGFLFMSAENKRPFSWDAEGMSKAFLSGYANKYSPKNIQDKLFDKKDIFLHFHKRSLLFIARRRGIDRGLVFLIVQIFFYFRLKSFIKKEFG